MASKEPKDYTISAVSRALKILKLFDESHRQMSLTEISALAGVNKSSVLRVLESLEAEGFIRRMEESKKYKLGLELFRLGNSGYEFIDLKNAIYPFVKKAVDATDLVAHVGILEADKVLVISRVWPENRGESIAMASLVGGIVPLHCTGVGKVLAAYSDLETQNRLLESCQYESYTEHTLSSREAFCAELSLTRKQGYGINIGEHESYLKCTTYPILNFQNRIIAAISLTGLTQVVELMDQTLIHQVMRQMVAEISAEMKYYNP